MRRLLGLLAFALLLLPPLASLAADPKPDQNLDSYGGTKSIRGDKTGFFHTQKTSGGRWMLVDPDGHGFFVTGMDSLGHYPAKGAHGPGPEWRNDSPELAAFDALLKKKYPNQDQWARAQLGRIRGMGFNTLVGARDTLPQRYPHAEFASVSGDDAELFKDVFSPEFAASVNAVAEKRCKPNAKDATLIGYFSDNELPWAKVWGGGFLDEYLSLPATSAGFKQAIAFLKDRYPGIATFNDLWDTRYESFESIASKEGFKPGSGFDRTRAAADREAFLEIVSRRYYSQVYQAFKKADPHHLVLGTRFLTGEVPLAVARGMRGNVDVVSANCYALRSFPAKFFKDFSEAADAPILLTEFGYSGYDSGIPMDHSGAIPRVVETQAERADKYAWYLKAALATPEIVGACWWWYLDGFAGHNKGNFGFIDWKDQLWKELADRATLVNSRIYESILSKPGAFMGAEAPLYQIRWHSDLKLDNDPSSAPTLDIHMDKALKYEGFGFEKADLRADAAFSQDRNHIYISIRVFDKEVKTYAKDFIEKNHPNIWEMDGVEIRLGWIQGLLYFDQDKPTLSLVPTDPMPGITTAGRILKDGYFLQAKIPKADLGPVIQDKHLRIAIGVNDGIAGERHRQLQWPASFEWIYQDTYAIGDLTRTHR